MVYETKLVRVSVKSKELEPTASLEISMAVRLTAEQGDERRTSKFLTTRVPQAVATLLVHFLTSRNGGVGWGGVGVS